jgi:hypothetical protein
MGDTDEQNPGQHVMQDDVAEPRNLSTPRRPSPPPLTRVRRVLAVALLAGSLGAVGGGCRIVSTKGTEQRPLSDFEPHLTSDLTPARARALFGTPSEEAGSGLLIYVYELEDDRELWLGFPGEAPIVYATVRSRDGSARDLAIR